MQWVIYMYHIVCPHISASVCSPLTALWVRVRRHSAVFTCSCDRQTCWNEFSHPSICPDQQSFFDWSNHHARPQLPQMKSRLKVSTEVRKSLCHRAPQSFPRSLSSHSFTFNTAQKGYDGSVCMFHGHLSSFSLFYCKVKLKSVSVWFDAFICYSFYSWLHPVRCPLHVKTNTHPSVL